MIVRKRQIIDVKYRKRPEPCRVVPISCLRVTETISRRENNSPIVNHSGLLNRIDSWKPLESKTILVEISPKSWKGLHNRVISSMPARLEVA
ncbi:MAG: hypothetical protein CMA12_07370 [Euryarchaeota archaeon]|nr:hypothetical protein [Euryarchaeota archaeon]